MKKLIAAIAGTGTFALAALTLSSPAEAQYREKITNDPGLCAAGKGPAVSVAITGIKESKGTIRIQSYRATKQDWLEKGRWIYRMEAPAKAGTMRFCMPLPKAGHYGIAVRHDVDGDGETDIFGDGGAMSNDPSINLFNLGKPSYKKVGFDVGSGVENISIRMRYR
ncbi:DUF2141 domain-containing protein [Qipengyuania huizhouensis]|uniref:DUF2141 domain-containing protein n=1 Tax=Qipengyuania huizhouensis TaxID=2867245 RepID=UPI001850FEA2|nr:DUF2141 domain-containing protein [Qipengyuania huizhouensis]MBA4764964.1 DUF2141 domain-containing protein [Erythrobacter sp.]MBX7460222.1 DUF2141 domain-containing protein [Qipengyuania huizhouensis]